MLPVIVGATSSGVLYTVTLNRPMSRPPPKLLPWSQVRVSLEGLAVRSTRELNRRRAIVALARWRAGEVPSNLRFADVTGSRVLTDPADVDWTGFPPSSAEQNG